MKIRLRSAVAFGLLAALGAASDPVRAGEQDATVNPLVPAVDWYEAGGVLTPAQLSTLAAMASDGRLLASLRQLAPAGNAAGGPGQADRRTLTIATFVLEAVSAQGQRSETVSVPLIEWACERLRTAVTPRPAERAWFVATLTLMESGGATPSALMAHFGHGRARFKDEPRFFFVDAWAQRSAIRPKSKDEITAIAHLPTAPRPPDTGRSPVSMSPHEVDLSWSGSAPVVTVGFNVATTDDSGRVSPPINLSLWMFPDAAHPPQEPVLDHPMASASDQALRRSREDYKHALRSRALAAEAELRLGDLDLSQGNPRNALDHFTRALKATTDGDLRYLAHALTAKADEALQRWSAAEAAYRKALEAAPNGRSAAVALAALLDRQGKADEASAVRGRVVDPAAVDPWTRFGSGDLLSYSALIEELRKAVR